MRRMSSTFGFLGFLVDTMGTSFSLVRHVRSDLFSTTFFALAQLANVMMHGHF